MVFVPRTHMKDCAMQGVEVQWGCSYWGSHRGSLRVEGYLQLLGSFPTQTELCLMYLKKKAQNFLREKIT